MYSSSSNAPTGLLPPGHRWGVGARTVLPYLVHSLEARPAAAAEIVFGEEPIRNPVFPQMQLRVSVQPVKS